MPYLAFPSTDISGERVIEDKQEKNGRFYAEQGNDNNARTPTNTGDLRLPHFEHRKVVFKLMAEQTGLDLNSLFEELADWEAQLKPLEKELFDELGGPEL